MAALTDQELRIVNILSYGKSNSEIGEELGIAANTVRKHLEFISEKLNTSRRAGIVGEAFRLGIIKQKKEG